MVKGEDKLEIIIIKIDTKIGKDQAVLIGECHIEVELSTEKIKEGSNSMIKIAEEISEEAF